MTALTLATILGFSGWTYPASRTVDHVDDYHGTKVADPYRWLEQPVSTAEVRDWVTAQNKLTFSYLDKIDGRDRILNEIKRRINFERFGGVHRRGGRVFYTKNDGLQNQSVFYVVDKPGATPRVLLDPNTLSKDGTSAVSSSDTSEDGKRLLYAISRGGSDWIEWRVRDVATGKDLSDSVQWSKFGNGVLNQEGTGFYYLRYPKPEENNAFIQANTAGAIWYHEIGTVQEKDVEIMKLENPDWFIGIGMTPKRDMLVFSVEEPGSINNHVWVKDLKKADAPLIKLFDANDGQYSVVGRDGDNLFIETTKDAPRGKVISVPIYSRRGPITVVPEGKDTLRGVAQVGGKLLCQYLRDAHSAATLFDYSGKVVRDIKFPGLGTAALEDGQPDESKIYYSYADFFTPGQVMEYDLNTAKTTVFAKPKVAFDLSRYEAKQVFYASKDGTKVPMFVVHRKGLKLNGKNPTLLYGYGGFNIPQVPWFSASRSVFMDMGGVFCVACIRGGGEYGKEWHESATKTHRQRAYDDFIAAGEWLISQKYADKNHLAIMGGSNGGLLVGACMTQRPDLFAVAIPQVGVMDLLRFNQFTIGKAWESDYGSPQNPTEFQSLIKISPYHNLKKGTKYPATLVTTADTDDRVVPAHSFKFAARLQASQAGDKPVLIRVETTSGHGASNLTKSLEEIRDIYAFILANTGGSVPKKF